jgi:membrane associated rhomboid family serine protease
MAQVSMGLAGQTLELNVCRRCEFVWFDAAEYEAIPPPPPPRDPDADLPQAAREALAIHKVQEMARQAQEENPAPDANWKIVPALVGLPVEMDPDPLTRLPLATLLLSLLIAAISIWAFFDLENVVEQFGLIPDEAWRYGGLTFLTSFFLHGGIFHLVSNLYFLIIFGIHVENYLGSKRWLLLIFLAAIVGDFLHIAADPRGEVPCIGASGGISGLIAFYAFKFPHAKLGILLRFGFIFIPKWIQFPAWCAFLLWLLLQFWGAYDQIAGFSSVSSLAHLGGTAVGVAFWYFWRKIELEPAPVITGPAN